MVKKIGAQNFDTEVMQAKGLVVVDMYADWCGPCKRMAPVMEALSEEYPQVTFAKVNVDEAPALADRFGVMSIPNFVLIKDGVKVDQFVGARDMGSFAEAMKKYI